MAISAFSNLAITLSDGGTVPSLDYLSTKTYVNIGSGNVLKVSWNTPAATNNAVDSYKVYILIYDTATASYKSLYSANIGNVNEFYVKSTLFNSVTQSFAQLRIYVEAVSKYGTAYNGTSAIKAVNVSKGSGSYVKVSTGYAQPIQKRTLAFAKVNTKSLMLDGAAVTDAQGRAIYMPASSVQDTTTGWTLMQQTYSNTPNGWRENDIAYEVLTDANGEIITDTNNDSIYVL